MKPVMIAAAILTLSGGVAFAQSGSGGASTSSPGSTMSPGASSGSGTRQAPIGHLQPRRSDTPSERSIDQVDPRDAALDRKIKSICRGC
ncbi:hypothetical protein [Rhodopseudomonas sp. BR0M22]|uniref:hypothetical protein n=1 Tax=Rhodopseudomonas sp. BR0M22 TaxID=2269369 RepID=UPI0013E04CAB|nr:hypothetical protein [Rhodopseudomonas sp. BR0M22]NEW91015.1 hypothetical protein [Rhodopseudomonas sp. BR0M22]